MTPREYYALAEVHCGSERTANYRAGLIASAVYNVNRQKASDHIFEPMEFFEGAKPKEHVEMDLDKLAAGMEYALRQCDAVAR